jgi:hypothetical protein
MRDRPNTSPLATTNHRVEGESCPAVRVQPHIFWAPTENHRRDCQKKSYMNPFEILTRQYVCTGSNCIEREQTYVMEGSFEFRNASLATLMQPGPEQTPSEPFRSHYRLGTDD